MSADKYEHEFRWESSVPNTVTVAGTFDNWNPTLHLTKQSSGKFAGKVQLEYGSKVLYKYIVDGSWKHNPSEPAEQDGRGIWNNVLRVPAKPAPGATAEPVKVPEATTAETSPSAPISNVMSAVIGAAAALPAAAILAVTGKDLTSTIAPADAPTAVDTAPEKLTKEKAVVDEPTPVSATAPTLPAIRFTSEPILTTGPTSTEKSYLQSITSTAAGAAIAAGLISTETGKTVEAKAKLVDEKVGEVVENARKAARAEEVDETTQAPVISPVGEKKESEKPLEKAEVAAAVLPVVTATPEAPKAVEVEEAAPAPVESVSTITPAVAAPALAPIADSTPAPTPTPAAKTNGVLPHLNGNAKAAAAETVPTANEAPSVYPDSAAPVEIKTEAPVAPEDTVPHERPSTPVRAPFIEKARASTLGRARGKGNGNGNGNGTPSAPSSPSKSKGPASTHDSMSEDSSALETPEGTPRKRKQSIFQKIRKSLTPKKSSSHRRASTAA